jgi:hypothetical protein
MQRKDGVGGLYFDAVEHGDERYWSEVNVIKGELSISMRLLDMMKELMGCYRSKRCILAELL